MCSPASCSAVYKTPLLGIELKLIKPNRCKPPTERELQGMLTFVHTHNPMFGVDFRDGSAPLKYEYRIVRNANYEQF